MTVDEYLDALTLEVFIDTLLERPLGQIICCNGVSGLALGHYDDDFVALVFEWWLARFGYGLRDSGEYSDVGPLPLDADDFIFVAARELDKLTQAGQDPRFLDSRAAAAPSLRLRCRRNASSKAVAGGFANVVDVERLLFDLISSEDQRRLAATGGILIHAGWTSDRAAKARVTALFTLSGEQEVELNTRASGTRVPHLGNPASVLWVSPLAGLLDDLGNTHPAECLRDSLGLIHHGADKALAALHLPAELVQRRDGARPTFADAGSHRRFRANADTARARGRSAWGCTVHLAHLESGRKQVDGRMERVVRPIPARDVGKVRVTPLGSTLTERGGPASAANDAAYAERLLRQCGGRTALRARLADLLGF
jgi:hypothetical protein